MLGIGLVNMLVALDQTTVSTALPSIVATLNGFGYYTWIASAYLLAQVIAVPIFGRLGDYYGRKPFVLAAIATFTIASALCAAAPTMGALIAARALQGIGAGMMTGTAFASIPDLFPDPKARTRWQVVLAAAYGIGTSAGPSLGGFLTDHSGWRSTFLINLPVGLVAAWCVRRYLPRFVPAARGAVRIDYLGALLLSLSLACLLLAFGEVQSAAFLPPRAIVIACLPVLLGLFYACEKRAIAPIVPLGLLHNRQMIMLLCLSLLTGAIMFSLIFYVPLLLQAGFNLSATDAGKLATPLAGSVAVGSLLNTRVVTRLRRPATVLLIGFSLLVLACAGVSGVTAGSGHVLLEMSLLCGGMGLGLILNNLNIFAQETAGQRQVGIATSLIQSARMIGGLLGVSTIGAWVSWRYSTRVGGVLDALSGRTASRPWAALFDDPQVLVDPHKQSMVLHRLANAPFSGDQAVESLRQMFVAVLHSGFYLTAGLGALGLAIALTVLDIEFTKDTPAARDETRGVGTSEIA
ncbi:MFS transporter [Trinickia terrae]|uniref:MFS transporter n=2 Tax=Trinickia terrae TaxID=2571161 RepID=A0A4U1IG95_9BURK|nr:MFS transporter [Trinickia terrae]